MKKTFFFLILLFPVWGFAQSLSAPYQNVGNDFFKNPDPTAETWAKIPETEVSLFPQNITTPSLFETTVSTLRVKALHNRKWFAVRLEWSDATKNIHVATDQASDACAIQLPVKPADQTSPFMGGKGAPVAILHWKAIWQEDVEGRYPKVKDLYPNTWTDTDRFGIEAGRQVKNPVSFPERKIPVEELIAEGFGTITTQQNQNALAVGVWEKGKWVVVFARPLQTDDKQDPRLKPGATTSIAFAVWEGSAQNVGGRKNYAPWVPFVLEGEK